MKTKQLRCSICGTINLNNFSEATIKKGSGSYCKLCKKEKDQQRYLNNVEKTKLRVKEYCKENKEKVKEAKRKYRSIKENKEHAAAYHREYRKKYKQIRNARELERLKTEPVYAIKKRLRNRILAVLKSKVSYHKLSSSTTLLGCSIEEFQKYFESKFTEGMSWNIFLNSKEIQIDHIIPCDSFDLSKLEEQRKCFHYTNLQPLWITTRDINGKTYIGNLNKGTSII